MAAPPKRNEKISSLAPKDEAAIIKYVLVSVYNELRIKSHSCESCNDVYAIWTQLKKILDEYGIKISQLSDPSS